MEKQLLEIFELSLDIHYYYDVSGLTFTYINPAITAHFGISPETIIGKNYPVFLDIIHPDDHDAFESHWNLINTNHFGNTNSCSCDYRCRTQAGKFMWFNETHRYKRNDSGKIVSVIGCIRDITDMKVVEILKSTSKERLTLAMEAASDSIWEWKITSNKLFFDARFYSILEYEPYEFSDNFHEWEKRMHPDDRKNSLTLLQECASGKNEQIHIEYRIRTKTNAWKWILCRAKVAAKNEEGKITKVIGTQTDITKLKNAEEKIRIHNVALREAEKTIQRNSEALQILYNNLKENEERLQLFFDEVKNIAFIMLEQKNNELILTEFSPGGENIFGVSKSEIINKSLQQVFNDHFNKNFAELILKLDKTNSEHKGEIQVYRKNGQKIACLLTVHFIVSNDSDCKKILAILTDIQERKEFELALKEKNEDLITAEKELKATNDEMKFVYEEISRRNVELRQMNEKLIDSEEKFRELAENTNDAFWLRDETKLLYINPSFEKVWGRDKNEIFENPQDLEQWVHPEDRDRYTKWDDFKSFSSIINYSEQFRIIKADGSIRWLWSRIHPVFNNGKIYRIAGIATDITELKQTEKALLRAKEKALESDNLKSAFLANISHEIRTPMNGILGFIELLNDESLNSHIRSQYLNIISKSSKQLLQIINDIIDISKIEADQVNIDIKDCNINAVSRDIFLFYQKDKLVLEKSNLKLRLDLSLTDDYAKIYTDESRLRQILMNLLDNAVKFTFEGEIVLGYKLEENNCIKFFIEDTGIGIEPEQYHLVFERFRQADCSATRPFGGTGLGLSISDGLAKLLGGEITFDSEVGVGSTFYLTLPYKPVNRRASEEKLNDEFKYNWENKLILIVEDDEINYELLKTMLEPTNATILHAASGEDAIRLFSANREINLILMDIRLPGINGYQAMRSIKDQDPSIPIIAQTAFAMAEDNQKCLEQGFNDYIAKPINRKLLYKIVQKQLKW